jgi:transcriptional regulator with XRE-family HTH domain
LSKWVKKFCKLKGEGVRMDINYKKIGARIAARRKQMELTQAEFAEKASLSQKYISKIESATNNALSIKSVLQLCNAMDVSPSYLLIGANDDEPIAGFSEVVHKLKMCDARQLRQVSKIIDALKTE